MPRHLVGWLCAVFVFSICAQSHAAYRDVLIDKVPHVVQKPDFCGEACAEMYLATLKSKWTQDQVFAAAGIDPALGRGCYTAELNAALKKIGIKTGDVWIRLPEATRDDSLDAAFKALHADLAAGVPSIVCMHSADAAGATEHMRLVLGYDSKADEIIYHEPAEKDGAYRHMKRELFLKLWPLQAGARDATVIRMRLEPDKKLAEPPARAEGFTPADYCQHVMKLKADGKIPEGFAVLIQAPFVVLGDERRDAVQRHADSTVKWAVERLKADYFDKDPDRILDIYLFKDRPSYLKHNKELFNSDPGTPYGYFSPAHGALVMNISTGGGTLVHEIVHPFMRANFPNCPAWFNEGMGSLYEQSHERAGHIVGLTNWRLAGLQQAIKAGNVPSFEKLTSTSDNEFYNKDKGTNYAQARYLCYYLQEKGLLTKFYKEFVANQKDDPTGYKTLVSVLEEKDMGDFQKRWEGFVMGLRFP